MLNIQIGNGSRASGFCCVSIGDGATTRGAYQIEVRSTLTFPENTTVEALDQLMAALQDINLTYKALVEQRFAPEDFGVRSNAAITIAMDYCQRYRAQLAATKTPTISTSSATVESTTVVPKEKEEDIFPGR